ncbi:hypothetical protein GcC1_168025, partial [Golovinomyces cichoracearum]
GYTPEASSHIACFTYPGHSVGCISFTVGAADHLKLLLPLKLGPALEFGWYEDLIRQFEQLSNPVILTFIIGSSLPTVQEHKGWKVPDLVSQVRTDLRRRAQFGFHLPQLMIAWFDLKMEILHRCELGLQRGEPGKKPLSKTSTNDNRMCRIKA